MKPSEVPTAPKSVDNTGGEAPREPEIVVLGGEIPADPPSTNTVSSATAKPDSGEDDEPLWEGGDVGFDPRSEEGADEPSSDD